MAKELSLEEAYQMVTPVADGEASEAEIESFFACLEKNPAVQRYYEEEIWLKQLVKQKCEFNPAPDHLREKIIQTIASIGSESNAGAELDSGSDTYAKQGSGFGTEHDSRSAPMKEQRRKEPSLFFKISLGLAALILFTLFVYLFNIFSEYSANLQADSTALPAVESHVYQFFVQHGGQLIEPDLASGTEADLRVEIVSMFQNDYSIPELQNIELAGVVQSELLPDYHTPLFEYKVDDNDIIYIFAFHIPEMEKYLSRSAEAKAYCIRDSDYHIQRIEERDIVSWKWEDNWYVGISHHDGETLVSLLPGETNR